MICSEQSGLHRKAPGWDSLVETQLLAHIPVRVTRSNGERFLTTTDDRGAYGFTNLPFGQYQIEEELPQGLERQSFSIEISPGPTGIGCRFDVFGVPMEESRA